MSVDLFMEKPECKTCGHKDEKIEFEYTYNVSKMWYFVYPDDEGMVQIDGMTGKEAYIKLALARDTIEANKSILEAMNPLNGYGSYQGFLCFINRLIQACIEYPDLKWSSWR